MSTKKSNITPLGDRVLVKPFSDKDMDVSAGGIIIPETVNKEKPEQGTVVAVGAGRVTDDGSVVPVNVKVGDKIIFSKYGPDEIKVEGEEYFVISESNILAVVE